MKNWIIHKENTVIHFSYKESKIEFIFDYKGKMYSNYYELPQGILDWQIENRINDAEYNARECVARLIELY